MKIIHSLNSKNIITKEVSQEDPGFLLTNKLGGYLWLTQQPTSRYQGWFFAPPSIVSKNLFKVIENIEIPGASRVSELRNNFWNIERERGVFKETFFLPSDFNSLIYEINQPFDIELVLDVKESYDNREGGRIYEISEETLHETPYGDSTRQENLVIIKYTQESSDYTPIFLAIKSDGGKSKELKQWVLRKYSFDKERNSPPFERYVFKALKLKAKKVVFSVSDDKNQAIVEAEYIFKHSLGLQESEIKEIEKLKIKKRIKNKEINLAELCAQHSLKGLLVSLPREACVSGPYSHTKDFGVGVYGGLPWFFQFWPRDEAICLKVLAGLQKKEAKEIFWRHIETINKQGKIFGSDDALGWIFKRASDFILQKKFFKKEVAKIKECLKKTIENLLQNETKNDFALNNPKQTWMDSQERTQATLEIQALRLNLYKLAAKLSSFGKERRLYSKLERKLREKVKKIFWDGKTLADGFEIEKDKPDFIIRPNVFLAAYIYPQLLTRKEWTKCFQNVLPKLFLPWGGISTIDKESPNFHPFHTGEPSLSYHQGDSWFFVNNLTALVLYQTDKKRFKAYIQKILKASTEEILWQGVIGHHGELSSAEIFRSQGCLSQAWSAAFYLELLSLYRKMWDG